jgi:hypothetical protein
MATKNVQKLIIAQVLSTKENEVLKAWTAKQLATSTQIGDVVCELELEKLSIEFLKLFRIAISGDHYEDTNSPIFQKSARFLDKFSISITKKEICYAKSIN